MSDWNEQAIAASWQQLAIESKRVAKRSLAELADEKSGGNWFFGVAGLNFDFSRHLVDDQAMKTLLGLAEAAGMQSAIGDLLAGKYCNTSEHRPALHTALRAKEDGGWTYHDENLWPLIQAVREQMQGISNDIRQGRWTGYTGKRIRHVINVGIGGSEFGARLLWDALKPENPDIELHFMGNLDRSYHKRLLKKLDPEETLVVLVSKSFRTEETLVNAELLLNWLQETMGTDKNVAGKHVITVTSNAPAASAKGFGECTILPVWDWVGGRYSVWSAVGLPLQICLGNDIFQQILAGAFAMDEHFATAPLQENLPVWMALLGIWYRNISGYSSHVLALYEDRLSPLVTFLQQLEMESNGKSVDRNGKALTLATSPVIWGGVGTPVQHTFFQALHQGSDRHSLDYILALKNDWDDDQSHLKLVSNLLAQASAMYWGRNPDELASKLRDSGMSNDEMEQQSGHRGMSGGRPSTLILMDTLDAASLGALMALYEHKVYAQSVIWNINAFDQWGVELGKEVAAKIEPVLMGTESSETLDSLTRTSIERLKPAG